MPNPEKLVILLSLNYLLFIVGTLSSPEEAESDERNGGIPA
jgi:hypothetical protein